MRVQTPNEMRVEAIEPAPAQVQEQRNEPAPITTEVVTAAKAPEDAAAESAAEAESASEAESPAEAVVVEAAPTAEDMKKAREQERHATRVNRFRSLLDEHHIRIGMNMRLPCSCLSLPFCMF